MCNFGACKISPVVHVVMDEDEQYDLCLEHLNYEVPDLTERFEKGKIFKDYAKQIITLEIPQ